MAKQVIGIGSVANDGTGDPLRTAFDKCNDNFTELYEGVVQSDQESCTQDTQKVVTFGTAFADTDYSLVIACYTASGLMVGFTRDEKTAGGFKITPVANCTMEWIAK